jgi:ATP-binding cassette subfamily B protein
MPTDISGMDMKWYVLRLLAPYLREFRGRITFAFVCLAFAKIATISLPFFLKHIVDNLDAFISGAEPLGTAGNITLIITSLILAYGLARFLNVIFNELRDTLFGRVSERVSRRVALQVFEHLHALDLDFHLNRRTGALSRDIERGVSGISFLLRFMIFNILPTIFELVVVIGIFLLEYSIAFAGVIIASIVVYVAFSVIATEKRSGFIRDVNAADSASNNRAIDSLLNYETVKYFTNERYESDKFDDALANLETARRANRWSLFALNGGQALIVSVSMTAMLWLAARGVETRALTLGDFVLVNTFMLQLFLPLNFLGFVYREIKGALTNIEQLFGLLGQNARIADVPDATLLDAALPSVEFDKVSFRYNAEREILHDISFTIAPGEKVAVVGSSGSGKSTLVKLLFRFYDCSSGTIRVGGTDVRNLQTHSLRGAIGIVPQDTVLFNDTIFNNIRYGRPEASDDDVRAAIRFAQLDDFIARLPQGADTLVGERGLKLSGGEKQRVAIARTILKRPTILIFDEATSALDSKTERGILEALREVARGHTSLAIAHRLSTVIDADRILVLDQGRITESGSHGQLLAMQGLYAEMWRVQQEERNKELDKLLE